MAVGTAGLWTVRLIISSHCSFCLSAQWKTHVLEYLGANLTSAV